MTWYPPVALTAPGRSSASSEAAPGSSLIPLPPHPGAFAVMRKHHVHEGVDIYCPEKTAVRAVEDGIVRLVTPFTGEAAGSPWWLPTQAVFVEGASGLVVYGEVTTGCRAGQQVRRGEAIAAVRRVLRHDKGLPTCMLHLELRDPAHREALQLFDWALGAPRPPWLLDPTPFLEGARLFTD